MGSATTQPSNVTVVRWAARPSVDAVVVRVLTEALSPSWRPLQAAARLVDHVQGNRLLLVAARARLLARDADPRGKILARGLATLTIALGSLDEPDDQRGGTGPPRTVGDRGVPAVSEASLDA